jgi:hypothetical protein
MNKQVLTASFASSLFDCCALRPLLAQPVVTAYRDGGRYDERFNSDDIQRLTKPAITRCARLSKSVLRREGQQDLKKKSLR